MTQGLLPGSRRFAEALLALAACFALVSAVHAEEAPPATTTNADAAKPKSPDGKKPADAKPADQKIPRDAKPAEPAGSVKPVEPPAATKPVEGAKPAAPAKPAKEAVPAKPAKPAGETRPAGEANASETAPTQVADRAPAPSSPEAETVWKAYEKRWSETADYSAGFRQIIEVPDVGSRVESAGRFYFAKPGLVRWEYTEGPPQTVVGDGTWIWLYQPDLEQVYKIPYAKAFGRGGLVELLAGREGVSERYTATLQRPDATSVRILLKSLTEGGGDLQVTLEADTFDIREVEVHDAAGSTTKMTFAEPRRNHGIDKARFTFTPPPAVDIITESEAGF